MPLSNSLQIFGILHISFVTHTGVYNGHTDIELSPEGIAQTIVVAESFRDKSISAIYSSDLKRCRDGAEIQTS
ncbi:MAG TPA: histidine phosphatase family protein [Nitrospirota bacterium]|nr:histidine phosphatase family protein [Nitrospirota bacterium]